MSSFVLGRLKLYTDTQVPVPNDRSVPFGVCEVAYFWALILRLQICKKQTENITKLTVYRFTAAIKSATPSHNEHHRQLKQPERFRGGGGGGGLFYWLCQPNSKNCVVAVEASQKTDKPSSNVRGGVA